MKRNIIIDDRTADQGQSRQRTKKHRSQNGGGTLEVSRNAYRHGLSLPLRLDVATSAKADAIARALAHDKADEETLAAPSEVARAQLELLRIRVARANLMTGFDLASGEINHLKRLAALDRYERLAATKRRRASHKL